MKYNLEHKLIFTENKNNSLFGWSISEVDADGKKLKDEFIPWPWSNYFRISEISINNSLYINTCQDAGFNELKSIKAKIHPEKKNLLAPKYLMFGTNRKISEFQLIILPLEKQKKEEYCTLSACASYDYENDFRNYTTNDKLNFCLHVTIETFAKYTQILNSFNTVSGFFSVSGVSGFYSHWSPSISTDIIKVLTDLETHNIENIKEQNDLPRSGKVSECGPIKIEVQQM